MSADEIEILNVSPVQGIRPDFLLTFRRSSECGDDRDPPSLVDKDSVLVGESAMWIVRGIERHCTPMALALSIRVSGSEGFQMPKAGDKLKVVRFR